jgi:hypothetical protein
LVVSSFTDVLFFQELPPGGEQRGAAEVAHDAAWLAGLWRARKIGGKRGRMYIS